MTFSPNKAERAARVRAALFRSNKSSLANSADLIGHPGQKCFVDMEGVTDFFLYEGLDKVFSTERGKRPEPRRGWTDQQIEMMITTSVDGWQSTVDRKVLRVG